MNQPTVKYCVIGDPIAHSLSPFIMNLAFSKCGIDATYVARRVSSETLADVIRELRSDGYSGANVTYPYKHAVIDAVDGVSREVGSIGAANTLVVSHDGVVAHNTDAAGVVEALRAVGGLDPAKQRALVFGAGGAARAAAYGLLRAGADSVTLAVREPQRYDAPVSRLRTEFRDRDIAMIEFATSRRDAALATAMSTCDIVINATPIGMVGVSEGTRVVDNTLIRKDQACFDFVYHPRDTAFLEAARRRGARTIDGLALLVAQAQTSFRLWTGEEFSLVPMYRTVVAHAEQL